MERKYEWVSYREEDSLRVRSHLRASWSFFKKGKFKIAVKNLITAWMIFGQESMMEKKYYDARKRTYAKDSEEYDFNCDFGVFEEDAQEAEVYALEEYNVNR